MKLECENIGKLSSANIDVNSVTLIAGLNSTGKSTVGKLLYCIFNSFYNFKENATSTLKRFILNQIFQTNLSVSSLDSCIEELYKLRLNATESSVTSIIKDFADAKFLESENKLDIEKIVELLNLSDDEIYKRILQSKFVSEFGNQIQNIFSKKKISTVSLNIKNNKISVEIKDNKIDSLKNFQDLRTEAIYIDDPFIVDKLSHNLRYRFYEQNHKIHLMQKLTTGIVQSSDMDSAIQDLLTTRKLEKIYNKIDSVCKGNIVSNKSSVSFQYENTKETLDICNLSTGLKTFSIIKALLLNGSLTQNGTIILDEPEIHLHPEWQKLLAEIIVLIQTEFNMHILINSHSPYFIKAIDVYAKKYKIRNTCKFYLSEDDESHETAHLKDVSDNLEDIYRLLFIPLQELEDERAEIEVGNSDD